MALAICFIQSLVEAQHVHLEWVPGKKCLSDLLTKILGKEDTEFHRREMGILEVLGAELWQRMTSKELQRKTKQESKQSSERLESQKVPPKPTDEQLPASMSSAFEETTLKEFSLRLRKIGSAIRSHQIDRICVEMFTSLESGFSQMMQLKKFQSIGLTQSPKSLISIGFISVSMIGCP